MSINTCKFIPNEWLVGDVYEAIGNTKHRPNGLPKSVTKIIADYSEEIKFFGESEWATVMNNAEPSSSLLQRVDPAPPLPSNIFDIWFGPCPIYRGKKISETHMLVYIPATLDEKPFTLNKLGEIGEKLLLQSGSIYNYMTPSIHAKLGDKPIKSHWVLMTKDVLPGSRNQSYSQQRKMVASLGKKSLAKKSLGYNIPKTLEAATCIIVQSFFSPKTWLFTNSLPRPTFIRCKETVDRVQVRVGGFSSEGLNILSDKSYRGKYLGIAALREL